MLVRLLIVLAVLEVGLPLLLWFARHRLMYFPSARPEAHEALPDFGPPVDARLVEIRRPDGRGLAAYDVAPAGGRAEGGPVILFLHGNAGNIAFRAFALERFVIGTGIRTVMPDYSGFGGNEGVPTEAEVVADARAALDHLVASGVPRERIVLYGESLGGAVALAAAEGRPCAGAVLQSTFSSTSSMALRIYPWLPLAALLTRGSFPSVDRVADAGMPLLVVHGDADGVVPLAEGRRLHGAAPPGTELLIIEGAGHDGLVDVAGEAYLRRIGELAGKWTGR